jgi:hypothetical protein
MGKYSLILILGFSIVVLGLLPLIHGRASRSYENYLDYYGVSLAHNIAASGANFGANMLFANPSAEFSYSNITVGGGKVSFYTTKKPDSTIVLTSRGKYRGTDQTIQATFGKSSFAKFGVYLATMGSVSWTTGDTVRGACHIENVMNLNGTPVFYGKVTTLSGTNPPSLPSGTTNPKFYGGYQSGISVQLPANLNYLQNAASSGGKIFTPPTNPTGTYEVRMEFNNNGTIWYSEYKGTTKLSDTTVGINQLAPNGVILVNGGNIRTKGTVNGKVTICATSGGMTGTGIAYINGDIRYSDDPVLHPESDDYLGIVAERDVIIPLPHDYPSIPCPTNIEIQACVFSRTGKFYSQLDASMGKLGTVYFYGSMCSYTIGAFSVPSGGSYYGYANYFQFDQRLLLETPPYYPKTNSLEILSWKE